MSLVITKETGNFFSLVLDQETPIISEQNRLTTIGDFCNFKTANGANLILKQNINYRDITIVTGVSYIPTSINNLWTHLIDNGFFTGLGLSGGASGIDRFDELLDTFSYFGRDGQLLIVNESELKLDTVAYQVFTEADALKLGNIETGAQVNINSNWNESNPESDAYIFNKPTFDGAFENLDNKQNSLVVDGTGTKYPTVDAVNIGIASATDKFYTYIQNTPSNTWIINHNLEKFPSATIVDSANTTVTGQVSYNDTNNLIITFNVAFSGSAYLN